MKLTTDQAREALQEAENMSRRATQARFYLLASPHLLMWGAIWVLAFGLSQWQPSFSGQIWLVLDVLGIAGSFMIAKRQKGPGAAASIDVLRFIGIAAALFVFFGGTFFVLRPVNPEQIAAFISLTFALFYALAGLVWQKHRLVLTGTALAAVTLAGYFFLHPYFFAWMAAVGAAVLVIGGLWMKRV